MVNLGRNDPCWCGSGKKYKKCHLAADEGAEKQHRAAVDAAGFPPVPRAPRPEPSDDLDWLEEAGDLDEVELEEEEEEDGYDDLVDRFTAADYEGKIEIFLDTLQAGEMDEEDAYNMLLLIRDYVDKNGDEARFRDLVDRLRLAAPDAYEDNESAFARWMIEAASGRGSFEEVPPLLEMIVEHAADEPDDIFDTIELLMYHGQTELVLATMLKAMPVILESEDIGEEEKNLYRGRILGLMLYAAIEKGSGLEDQDLRATLSPFSAVEDWDTVRKIANALVGRLERAWTLEDFRKGHRRGRSTDAIKWDLGLLSFEWQGEIFRGQGVPLTKSELARHEIVEMQVRKINRRKEGISVLIPRESELDRHLGPMVAPDIGRPTVATAVMELLPDYLRFLVRRGLITGSDAQRTLGNLRNLHKDLVLVLRHFPSLKLAARLELAWEEPIISPS